MAMVTWKSKTSALGKRKRLSTGSKRRLRRRIVTDVPSGLITRLTKRDSGFSPEVITTIKYIETLQLTSTSNSLARNAYRLNGAYDPDATGTGHQPMYYDALATVYGNYVVLGSKITCHFAPQTTTAGPCSVGIWTNNANTWSATTDSEIMEQNACTSAIIGGYYSGSPRKLTATYSPSRDLGRSPDDDTVGAAVNANPSQQYYAWVWFQEKSTVTPSVCQVRIEIEYRVKFFKQAFIAQN